MKKQALNLVWGQQGPGPSSRHCLGGLTVARLPRRARAGVAGPTAGRSRGPGTPEVTVRGEAIVAMPTTQERRESEETLPQTPVARRLRWR